MAGVVMTPALSTRAPAWRRPAARVAAIQGPDSRVSRPRITLGTVAELRREWPKASPAAKMVVGSRGASPATARMPSVPKSLRVHAEVIISLFQFFARRRPVWGCGFNAAGEDAIGEARGEGFPYGKLGC